MSTDAICQSVSVCGPGPVAVFSTSYIHSSAHTRVASIYRSLIGLCTSTLTDQFYLLHNRSWLPVGVTQRSDVDPPPSTRAQDTAPQSRLGFKRLTPPSTSYHHCRLRTSKIGGGYNLSLQYSSVSKKDRQNHISTRWCISSRTR